MTATPTGSKTEDGALRLLRVFPIDQQELWNLLTEPAQTDRWIGPWSGDPASGSVELTLNAEEGRPAMEMRIIDCDASSQRLVVESSPQDGEVWRLQLQVLSDPEGSLLEFVMPNLEPTQAGSIGPGWEFYLDRLLAAAAGQDPQAIRFDPDYYPALRDYYELLFKP
ncbi:ATPase [Glutamicibacter sp. BSL13]